MGTNLVINGLNELDITGATVNYVAPDKASIAVTPVALKTNGTLNSTQSTLNLAAGSNVTLSESAGTVTIASTGGGGAATQVFYEPRAQNFVAAGTRAVTTTKNVYQNTTGVPIIVQVAVGTASTANFVANAYTDASNPPTTIVNTQTGCNTTSNNQNAVTLVFIVKPGDYYAVTISAGTANLNNWREVQMATGAVTYNGNVAASRALATDYQNTSGKTRWVIAAIQGVSAASAVRGLSDSASPSTSIVDDATQTSSGAATTTVVMCVPNNYYYKITAATGSILTWYEYDWAVSCARYGNLSATGTAAYSRIATNWNRTENNGNTNDTVITPRSWLNDSGNGRWVVVITSNSTAAATSNMLWGEGTPPFEKTGASSRKGQTTVANIAVYSPIPAWKFYIIDSATSGTLTQVAWWEYDFTP